MEVTFRKLEPDVLDQLFRLARSRNAWRREWLPDEVWVELYDLLKFGPTSANSSPARFVFCVSEEAKARVCGHMSKTNAEKSIHASAIVIVAQDLDFAEQFGTLFPHAPGVKSWFADPKVEAETAFRNSALQGAYLIVAARALGLDAGPISGFDQEGVDRDFFADTRIKSNFVCMLGKGVDEPFDRLPRLSFDQACQVL